MLGDRVQGSNLLLPSLLMGQGSHLRTSKMSLGLVHHNSDPLPISRKETSQPSLGELLELQVWPAQVRPSRDLTA